LASKGNNPTQILPPFQKVDRKFDHLKLLIDQADLFCNTIQGYLFDILKEVEEIQLDVRKKVKAEELGSQINAFSSSINLLGNLS